MIVYVESNFVLELALLRDRYRSCLEILDLSRNQKIHLAIPSFSIGEPYEAWVRRSKNRKDLHEKLRIETSELTRSKPYRRLESDSAEFTKLLIQSIEEEKQKLDKTLKELISLSYIISINSQTLISAIRYQNSIGLSPQDSIVYSSVISHASRNKDDKKCFLNRNSRDFMNPDIIQELDLYNCKLLVNFTDGLNYIRDQIQFSK